MLNYNSPHWSLIEKSKENTTFDGSIHTKMATNKGFFFEFIPL